MNANGGFGIQCADIASEVRALRDVLERHARA